MIATHFANGRMATSELGELPFSLAARLNSFAQKISRIDKSILDGHQLTGEDEDAVSADFQELMRDFDQQSRALESIDPLSADQLGRKFQVLMLPYLLLTGTAERWYSKPRGYAGDYFTIHQVYENRPSGHGRIGALLDRCFLDVPAARAVRNRRNLLAKEILCHHAESRTRQRPFVALSLACGPAAEVFDILEHIDLARSIQFHLIDIDLEALAFVNRKATTIGVRHSLTLHRANVFRLTARRKLDMPLIDFAYSLGLIDYFDDRHVKRLLDFGHEILAPGGQMILGNFHPQNPNRALMESVLEWKLIHRTEEDMCRLCEASRFGRPFDRIVFEDQGVNLFAVIRKRVD